VRDVPCQSRPPLPAKCYNGTRHYFLVVLRNLYVFEYAGKLTVASWRNKNAHICRTPHYTREVFGRVCRVVLWAAHEETRKQGGREREIGRTYSNGFPYTSERSTQSFYAFPCRYQSNNLDKAIAYGNNHSIVVCILPTFKFVCGCHNMRGFREWC
jgi:hypothetical protein